MLKNQGASPEDGEVYANMALDELARAKEYNGGGGSGPSSSCGNRKQQRVRADLMLSVLYDMLGRYGESDKYLDEAFEVRRQIYLQ